MIKNSFIVDCKDKFMKKIAPIEKGYDYYLGLVIDKNLLDDIIIEGCKEIYEKSSKNIRLIKSCKIDNNKLLIFELNPEFADFKINGILKSISRYLKVTEYQVNYVNSLQTMVFDAWGTQLYTKIVDDNKEYLLDCLKGGI